MKTTLINNRKFENLLSDFSHAITVKGYNPYGIGMYTSCVREFLAFLESLDVADITSVSASDIIAYHGHICERPNARRGGTLGVYMIRHHHFSLRLFFDFLVDSGELEHSPARIPKFSFLKANERKVLEKAEVRKMYSACKHKHEHALLALAYGCGLRRNEIVQLNIDDVFPDKGFLIVREGKNHKSRTVPLSADVAHDLKEYLHNQRLFFQLPEKKSISKSLFITKTGKRIHGNVLNQRLKSLVIRTHDIKLIRNDISLHTLRHSIATHLADNGANIEFVQKFLGHSGIDTAHLYARNRKRKLMVIQSAQQNKIWRQSQHLSLKAS